MIWQETPYTLPLMTAGIISLILAVYIWQRRPAPGAEPLAIVMTGVVIWVFAYALQLASSDLKDNLFWARIKYLGIVMIPTCWLAMALQYIGQSDWLLSRRTLSLLSIHPLVMIVLIWTNEYHGLIWNTNTLDATGSFMVWIHGHGVGFWAHTAYSYILVLTGSLLLIRSLFRSRSLYQGQTGALLTAALAPIAGNLIYLSNWEPFPHLDMTPFAFTITGLAMVWGLFRFQLFDILPAARSAVIESMSDGMLVLDPHDRIIDINPAAQTFLNLPLEKLIGCPADEVLDSHADLVKRYRNVIQDRSEVEWHTGGILHYFDLQISPLRSPRGRYTGRVITIRDITERKQAQEALSLAHDELELRVQERTADLEQTNTWLQTEIAERQRVEDQLRSALQEKEVMLKEIHHRVKNNLQIISSLLNLQATSMNNPLTEAMLRDTRDRVRSMALIHEKLYQSPDLARIDFAEYVQSLANHLFQSYAVRACNARLKMDLDSAFLSIDMAIPCGLIINELVSNALKYAFPNDQHGTVEITFHPDNAGHFVLRVADNGIGLPESFDFHSTTSLGLQLVTSLVTQLEGTIELDCHRGTAFEITFRT